MHVHPRTSPALTAVAATETALWSGVEEEFFVVDTGDGAALECNHDVVAAASEFGIDLASHCARPRPRPTPLSATP
jgi:hypothetical protein